MTNITIGVLALQGAFSEHIQCLRQAATFLSEEHGSRQVSWRFLEVRTPEQLSTCDALILPGGESTAISLVAARSGLLEPLRDFVKVSRKPVWGTCAGLILLAESANRTKQTGQDLIGGLDVRVNRNHFGRQVESFEADLDLPFLASVGGADFETSKKPFRSVFIRAPVVEKILEPQPGIQTQQSRLDDTVVAPSKAPANNKAEEAAAGGVEVLARLPGRAKALKDREVTARDIGEEGDIVAVKQGNVFGTSFHPELTGDSRIHVWWMERVMEVMKR
ncbi:Senecionine N-oxygenase [Taxawa tesnikishii (nom. ined.)]|nr:Senecionine N-oxygenase [Dothideales sp. JES 119]